MAPAEAAASPVPSQPVPQRWERSTGSEAGRSLRGVVGRIGYYGIAALLGNLAPFILIPLYLRSMSPAQYGQFELMTSLLVFAIKLGSLGLGTGLFRFYARADSGLERRETVGVFLSLGLLSAAGGLALWGAMGAMAGDWLAAGSARWSPIFPYLALLGVLYSLAVLQPLGWSLLRAKNQAGTFAALTGLSAAASVLLVTWTVPGSRDPVKSALLAQIAAGAVVCAALAGCHRTILCLRWNLRRFREVLQFSLPLVPGILLMWALDVADRTLLAHFHGGEALAVYSLGYKFGFALGMVSGAFTVGWVPHLLQVHGKAGADRELGRLVAGYFGVLLFGAMALNAAAPFVLEWCAPPVYRASAALVLPVALGYVANGAFAVATAGVHLSGNSRVLLKPLAAGAGLNLVLNLLLIPRFGGLGAAWATLVSFCLAATLAGITVRSHFRISFERAELRLLGGAAMACLALALLQLVVDNDVIRWANAAPLVGTGLSLACYAVGKRKRGHCR